MPSHTYVYACDWYDCLYEVLLFSRCTWQGQGAFSLSSPSVSNAGRCIQDVVFVEHRRPWPGRIEESFRGSWAEKLDDVFHHHSCTQCGHSLSEYSLFCVFDGHNGKHAAKMSGDYVLRFVEAHLPRGNPPAPSHPDFHEWRQLLQKALVLTIVDLNTQFAEKGIHAGCTATVVLVTGWLVTSANLGDSHAYLDTGNQLISLTAEHRVAAFKKERKRVERTGAVVAPVSMSGSGPADDYSSGLGPLRVWPGGLSISRAIGDFDVGPSIVPFAHVVQVSVPTRGARLLIGSDGVWDAFASKKKPGTMTRSWSTNTAPSKVIQNIVRTYGRVKDDTSLIIVDVMPKGTAFPEMASTISKRRSMRMDSISIGKNQAASTGCFCFSGSSGSKSNLLSKSVGDDSMKSSCSAASYMGLDINVGMASVLSEFDLADVLGLMPDRSISSGSPEWLHDSLKQDILEAAEAATQVWLEASGRCVPMATRPSRVSFAPGVVEQVATDSAMKRNASVHFGNAVAEDGAEYAAKFGHYNRSQSQFGSTFTDPSVRAGRVYNTEASVHAGKVAMMRDTSDPSVRLRGSDIEGSVHLRAREIPETVDEDEGIAREEIKVPGLRPIRTVKRV